MEPTVSFIDTNPDSLGEWCKEHQLPGYRTEQLLDWVYQRLTTDFDTMSNLPSTLRKMLAIKFRVLSTSLKQSASDPDGTAKYVFSLPDGHSIESVYLPSSAGYTLCISSQIGCALGCKFCATGTMGIVRNLSTGEIVSQVIHVRQISQSDEHGNIVFMGMGEPLLNTDAVAESIRRITDLRCMAWSPRRITVSTAGIVPEIRRFGQLDLGVNLAVSLNAPDDAIRSRLMPVNKKYPLKVLMAALKDYPLPSRQHQITYEYIMLDGINDHTDHAEKLIRLLDPRRDKVNLIPFNTVSGSRFRCSAPETILRFQNQLENHGLTALIRNSRGTGIAAACGQLASRISFDQKNIETRHDHTDQ